MTLTYEEAGIEYDEPMYQYDGNILSARPGYRTMTVFDEPRTLEKLVSRTATIITESPETLPD